MNRKMDLIEIIEKTVWEDPERLSLKFSAIEEGIAYSCVINYRQGVYTEETIRELFQSSPASRESLRIHSIRRSCGSKMFLQCFNV